jgi:anaerobic magnesium-protoporphyrin IX monomethyl ester cyclase
MRVLLVNSPWICNKTFTSVKAGARWPHVRSRKKTLPYYPYPFAMAYATANLVRAGHTASLLDAVALEMSTDEALNAVVHFEPDMVILETSTPSIRVDLDFARSVSEHSDAAIVFSGPHATALPDAVLSGSGAVAVLRGEYDETVLDLVSALESGGDLSGVAGISRQDGSTVYHNPDRPLIRDLDALPYPERESLPMEKYTDPACRKFPNVSILTSRGCPHSCVFCLESTVFFHSPSFRRRHPECVVDEMQYVTERFGAREVYFDDSSFTADREHARAVAEAILKRDFSIPWSAMADARVDDDTLKLLKRANCIGLKFGVETADADRMAAIRKNLDLDHVQRFVASCKKLGIATHGTFMFGLPGETRRSLRKTLEYAERLRCTTSQFSVATPFPGTPFYDQAVREGWLITDDWSRWDGAGSSVLAYPECSPEDIVEALEMARKMKIRMLLKNPPVLMQYIWKLYKIKGLHGLTADLVAKTRYLLENTCTQKAGRQ